MKHVKQLLLVFGFFLFFSCSGELVDEIKDLDKSVITKKTKSQWEERDLFQVNFYQIGNLKSKFSDQKFLLNESLIIEEIDFKTYQKANEIKTRYYLKDTLVLMKRNNSIVIGKTRLSDFYQNNGRFEYYTYLGYFPKLNQYLIRGEYLDSLDYKLIDKNTGEIKISLISYPIISKNGNFISTIKTNALEKQTYFEIFQHSQGYFKPAFKAIFTNWKVVNFEETTFWGNDGSLYTQIEKIDENKNSSYLKITLN